MIQTQKNTTFMKIEYQVFEVAEKLRNVLGTDCSYIFKRAPYLLEVRSEIFKTDTGIGVWDDIIMSGVSLKKKKKCRE